MPRETAEYEAMITTTWDDDQHCWRGWVQMDVGHVCDCPRCHDIGLSLKGSISTGPNERTAIQRATDIVAQLLASVMGMPMAIFPYPGENIVVFKPEVVSKESIIADDFDQDNEEEFEDREEGVRVPPGYVGRARQRSPHIRYKHGRYRGVGPFA